MAEFRFTGRDALRNLPWLGGANSLGKWCWHTCRVVPPGPPLGAIWVKLPGGEPCPHQEPTAEAR